MTAAQLVEPVWETSRRAAESHLAGAGRLPVHVATLGVGDALRSDTTGPYPEGEHLPVHLYGRSVIVGPPAGSGTERPCPQCLARRWQQLRSEDERHVIERGATLHHVAPNPYVTPLGMATVTGLIAELTGGDAPWPTDRAGHPQVYEVRLDSLQIRCFPLIADADCPRCGDRRPDSREGAVIELRSRTKRSTTSTRLVRPADYGLVTEAYANPVCGMLGTIAGHAFDSTTTAPVTGVTKVRGSHDLHEFYWSGHADNFDDSTLLGVFEGLERHAGLLQRSVATTVYDSYDNVRADALDPRDCTLYPDRFYELIGPRFTRFSTDLRIPWVWGYSLRDNRPILVPQTYVYYLATDHSTNFLAECSNGCATGSTIEEAILYGVLELIERDAFLLGWYGRAPLPEIDVATCTSPATRQMVDRMSLMGYDVRLFDNRIDFAVPAVTGVAVRRDGGLGTLCFAAGSSLDPEDAVRAALCEIASYVPSFADRTEASMDLVERMLADHNEVTGLRHHPLLFGVPEMAHHADFLLRRDNAPKRSMADLYGGWQQERPRTTDLLDDLRFCLDELTGAGFDVIVADQTSPEQRAAGLCSAAVIVPGLVPIDFGATMQRVLHMPRLRTAFRRAGWRDTDLADHEINYVPHPFP